MLKKLLSVIGIVLLLVACVFGVRTFTNRLNKKQPTTAQAETTQQATKQLAFNKKQYSNDDPTSIWVVVNKHRPLKPVSYTPADLVTPDIPLRVPGNESMKIRKVTATALETMFTAAKADSLDLMLSSGYRSYNYQVGLYNGYVTTEGQVEADKTSARPGFSEHQTGLAADIEPISGKCDVDECFAATPEGIWLAANAYKYGFLIRYQKDKVPVTGYSYEPWHVRYIGADLSNEMHTDGITTLEEFFSLSAAPDYSP